MKISKILNVLFLSIFVLTVFLGCHKEKIETRFYPRLRTLNVTDVSPEGATFRGEVITPGNSPVLEYGFVWSDYNSPTLEVSEYIVINEKFSSGKFSCRIDYSLIRDASYYVRSFVKTEELVVYGDIISFVSDGTKPPVITEVMPPTGFWGDTVSIVGERFSSLQNEIYFGDVEAKVFMNSDSLIKAVVPSSWNIQSVDIELRVYSNSTIWSEQFHYKIPVIKGFSPQEALWGDTVTIRGENFDPNPEFTKAFFNDIESDIVFLSETIVKTIVPDGLKESENQLTIFSDSFRVSSGELFSLTPFYVTDFSPDTFRTFSEDLLVTIRGKGFSSNPDFNSVMLEGNKVEVVNAWPDSLQVMIPRNLLPANINYSFNLKGAFEITVADYTLKTEDYVYFINKGKYTWSSCSSFPAKGRIDAVSFSLNGKGYVGTGLNYEDFDKDLYFSDFWEYNPQTDNWIRIDDLPGPPRSGATILKVGEMVFVGMGRDNSHTNAEYFSDWYRFNPSDGSWTQLNDFPGNGRYGAFSFTVGDVSYVGGGSIERNEDEQRSYFDFWTYDVNPDSWIHQDDMPYQISESDGFSWNNAGYVFSGGELYVFENGSWSRYGMPGEDLDYSSFMINGKGYRALPIGDGHQVYGSKNILAVDLENMTTESIYFPARRRSNATTFVIDNSAYIVGGTTYDNGFLFLTDVYELSIDE